MISIISPAKSLNLSEIPPEVPKQDCDLSEKTLFLKAELKKLTIEEIAKMMKISNSLAELNHTRYQQMDTNRAQKQSLFMFDGDVYNHIRRDNYGSDEHQFASNHLRILSGLYGLLHPYQPICAYRLEMGTKLSATNSTNLANFWQDEVTQKLNTALEQQDSKHLINLASKEYSSAINRKNLNADIIDVDFLEERNGLLKNIAFNSKRARGMMVDFIISNKIDKPSGIKDFNQAGYNFSSNLSSGHKMVFCRQQSAKQVT